MSVEKEIATESGHWYLPDGTPFYTVPRKTGKHKGEPRAVSLRWDRKLMTDEGVVPSTTSVTRILDKPALVRYRAQHLFKAVINLTKFPGESEEAFFERCLAESDVHRDKAAERGAALHGAIEKSLRCEPYDEAWKPHIDKITNVLAQLGISIFDGETEKSFAHPLGFGGKCDWHQRIGEPPAYRDNKPLVLDFKSKDDREKCETAASHGSENVMQLASYREGLRLPNARCMNIFVGCDDLHIEVREWTDDDLRRAWVAFQHALAIWQWQKNYYPTQKAKS